MSADDNNWTNCGGKIKEIVIKISDDLGNECVTKSKMYIGQDIVWNTKDILLNCAKMKIYPLNSHSHGN